MAMMAGAAQAQETIRLGNLKFAHFGAVSYIKEIAPKCGIKVEEKVFAKGLDVMQAIIAGELDVGATASEAAIAGRAGGAPIVVVAGFASGGARLVARPGLNIKDDQGLERQEGRRDARRDPGSAADGAAAAARPEAPTRVPGKDVQLVYLAYADLNQALLGKNIDAMMQSEPQSSQAINKGFGVEVLKPYDTPIGEPIRTMVMTEKFYGEKRAVAEKFMRCFVDGHQDASSTTRPWPRSTCASVMFKGQITERRLRRRDQQFALLLRHHAEHIQVTTDTHGQDRRRAHEPSRRWPGTGCSTDLLDAAKKSLNVK